MPQARPSQTPAWNKLRLFMHLHRSAWYGPYPQQQNRRKPLPGDGLYSLLTQMHEKSEFVFNWAERTR